jgi:hypothetical protein|tara:strand:- start:1113 stop:1724 length:612 start_codon:yes stop_codon:yes gene_type:complete
MAFQIKKELHLNTGIYLKLLDDPTNAKMENDRFGNTKYTLPIEMAGHDITDGSGVKWFKNAEGQWIELKLGKQTDFEFSDALYKKLAGNPSGSTVQVMLKEMEGKQGKYAGWTVMPMSSGSTESSNKPQKAVSNASLGITWGMCINNATQIAIKQGIDGMNLGDQIEQIAKQLMDVAVNGLVRWEQGEHEKDQNDKPNDDLPF